MKTKIKNKYVKEGLTIFLAGAALISFYFVLANPQDIFDGIGVINNLLTPFYVGIIMAYLLCPIYNGTVRLIYRGLSVRLKTKHRAYKFARFAATVVSLTVLIAAIASFFYLLIPDLWESIVGIVNNIEPAVDKITIWVNKNIDQNSYLVNLIEENLQTTADNLKTWVQEKILPGTGALINGLSIGIKGTFTGVLNIFIALIICVYVLNSKELFQAQAKKLILAVFKPERAEKIFELGKLSNDTFGGFINGKIIDSIIIGIICFIVMCIMKLPLATLISVIVGVTNIIPFFGPFIGAIPSGLLLLIIDPMAALKFGIMILVLQQVDGNIIGPKILGGTTGLASFWVMFAIIVGGGMFGFAGMILGVPVFAIFYVYLAKFINNRLKSKGLDSDTVIYEELGKYNINKQDVFGEDRSYQPHCSGEQQCDEQQERKEREDDSTEGEIK